jgi:hypothetical protein
LVATLNVNQSLLRNFLQQIEYFRYLRFSQMLLNGGELQGRTWQWPEANHESASTSFKKSCNDNRPLFLTQISNAKDSSSIILETGSSPSSNGWGTSLLVFTRSRASSRLIFSSPSGIRTYISLVNSRPQKLGKCAVFLGAEPRSMSAPLDQLSRQVGAGEAYTSSLIGGGGSFLRDSTYFSPSTPAASAR